MMNDFFPIFHPQFILHNALWGSVVIGFFCPLIGVYFYLRRMVLLGVALPQISAAGIALAFLLQGFGISWSLHAGEPNDRMLALIGSIVCTVSAILILGAMEKRDKGTPESRLGAVYAIAFACSVLFVASNPSGKIELLAMLQGEIVSVSSADLHLLLATYAILGALLLALNRHFLFVSFDRESAQVMGKNVMGWDIVLYLLIGVSISIGVLTVGPMMTFAFLIIPPLAARRLAPTMGRFFLLSSLIGGASGLVGFYVSYHNDWPLSPTAIMASAVFLGIAHLIPV
jgi:ABC-type Mn2+/Zn2+ transport system permease subunit